MSRTVAWERMVKEPGREAKAHRGHGRTYPACHASSRCWTSQPSEEPTQGTTAKVNRQFRGFGTFS